MKRIVLLLASAVVLVVLTAIWVYAAPSPGIRGQPGDQYQWVIPPAGVRYCFSPESNLPADLPACPNAIGGVTPDPEAGPVLVSPKP